MPDSWPHSSSLSRKTGAEGAPRARSQAQSVALPRVTALLLFGTAFDADRGWSGTLVASVKRLDLKGLLRRVGLTGVVLGCAAWSAQAQEAPVAWPENLKHRNARYAVRERVSDEAGDRTERVLRDLVLHRVTDPLGDREELRRLVASKKVPPRLTAQADVTRCLDPADDREQAFVARLPRKERRHAETRRFRDLAGDQQELLAYQRGLILYGPLRGDGPMFADEQRDARVEAYFDDRGDVIRRDTGRELENEEDPQRRDEDRAERQDDRDLTERRDPSERAAERSERDAELTAERDAERAEKDEEKDADKDAEKADEKAERDVERDIEKGDVETDRDTERQIQREDEKNDEE